VSIEVRQIGVIAEKEFWDRIRNRWALAVAAVFTAFALVIAYLGAAQQGAVGFRGIDVTIAGLVSLVIYLVPLIALILGYDAIVGERDRGSLECCYPCRLPTSSYCSGSFSASRWRSPFLPWPGLDSRA
jgi:Cu-processing system permease protein